MGKKGRTFEFMQERDKDLMEVYRTVLAGMPYGTSLTDILNRTVNSPSKRFWVSTERACNIINAIRSGKDVFADMHKNKKLMFIEIDKRVSLLQKLKGYKDKGIPFLVEIVLEQPAPCFYMTPESAKVIIHHIKKRWKQERLKHLSCCL